MGQMTLPPGAQKTQGTRPTPKSKNKKSLGPSMRASSGTHKTNAGSNNGKKAAKAGKNVTPKAAGEKKGTVYRSSKASRGAKTKKSASPRRRTGTLSLRKPVSRSRGKNSSTSSSRPFGQR